MKRSSAGAPGLLALIMIAAACSGPSRPSGPSIDTRESVTVPEGPTVPAGPPPAPTPAPPVVSPPARFTLTGRVVAGGGGQVIASARIDVSAGVNAGESATSDAEGRYTMTDLTAGEMTLQVSAAGHTPESKTITLGANQSLDFNLPPIAPERVTLSGVVSVRSTAPCPVAAVVEITSGADAGRTARVDHSGRYVLANLHTGAVTVDVSAPAHLVRTASLTLTADETRDFRLDPSPYLTTGRAIDAVTQSAVAGVKVEGDGVTGIFCESSGAFLVTAARASTEPRPLVFTGPDRVERRTNVRVPGADLLVSMISGGFDLRAFDEMFRSPQLRRWTEAPPLLIETRSLQFTDMHMMDAVALDEVMPAAEAAALMSDLTWALPQLTGGVFADFRSVASQQSAQGARVGLLNNDVITVSRVVGLTAATGFWGFARCRLQSDGRVTAGMIMLDRDFDRSGSAFTRSLRAHELGHALGYQHVTARTSVMNSQARTEPNDFDRDAAFIAFQRPPGNQSPDVDPSSAWINRRGTATWSPPVR